MKTIKRFGSVTILVAVFCAAFGIVVFDPSGLQTATGWGPYGFAGKGDIQLVYGWNNKALQDCGAANFGLNCLDFRFSEASMEVVEYSWTCDRDSGPQTQERARTVTTTVTSTGVADDTSRDSKKQITGFKFVGLSGTSSSSSSLTEGPPLWSCPTGWTAINMVTGDPVVTDLGSAFEVRAYGGDWFELTLTPAP